MNKYKKGTLIKSLDELIKQEFIYFNDRLINRGWFQNWQLHWVVYYIASGKCFKARIIQNNKKENKNV